MCFSAPVSFAASAFVAGAGALALRETRTVTERPLASVPLLFAMQQFVEGVLWLLLPQIGTGGASHLLVQIYAFFIGVIWPMVIPLGILLIEPDRLRKRLMTGVLAIGVIVAIGTFIIILRYGVEVAVVNHCLVYSNPFGGGLLVRSAYVIATCAAYFLSSHRSVRWIGIAMIGGFGVAYSFYHLNWPSVWCFFAALVSALIYYHFRRSRVAAEAIAAQ
ncbi:DUF6629 family protein [Asticcacaulis taihuensis]|jgi:hypothetical protein|uniref:Uncharacterized protein n=1 Tax=Asticcacaulis taihuensis TaxID=260084 RepID=A0A1G4RE03_9CAUL|nr:DUF6629 family protein [Asticcacaulis taihuensis]SCW55152.1 hypothetical protein SAMN02927928_1832 [Asticcacaulis taihuensis]